MSVDEGMIDRLIAAAGGTYDHTLAGELKRTAAQLKRGGEQPGVPKESAEKMLYLAKLVLEAGNALTDVRDECNKVLDKVGASDKPVAAALRDFAKIINRKARGRWAYL